MSSKLPDFSTLFDAAATELDAAMKRSSIGRRPDEVGAPRESAFRKFLEEWLPESCGIANGYAVSTRREISKQSDILLFRRLTCPKFVTDAKADIRLIPIEELYGTIEVKSTLTRDELTDAVSKCASVTDLAHSGRENPTEDEVEAAEIEGSAKRDDDLEWRRYRVKMPNRRSASRRPFTAILAYKGAKDASLEDITLVLKDARDPVDCVAVLNAGVIILRGPASLKRYKSLKEGKSLASYSGFGADVLRERLRHSSRSKSHEYIIESCKPEVALMFFYASLFEHLQSQTYRDYDPMDYLAIWKSNKEAT